jgi:hypothetical protein
MKVKTLYAALLLAATPGLIAQQTPAAPAANNATAPAARPALEQRGSILFIGNSFTFADKSPAYFYRAQTVTDLNGGGIGGVPALFKAFANQAGLDFAVSLETSPGKGLDWHFTEKAEVIGRSWDYVVMHGFSTLDSAKPGDPSLLVSSAKQVAELLHGKNPQVDIRLMATWSRADQTYPDGTRWHGQPIEAMARDVRAGYDLAAAGTPFIRGVIPVGEAWNRAIQKGVADPNPYDGIAAGQINLWAYDHYHASIHGYYLEALMDFGAITGLDPRSLGRNERTAFELGISPAQAAALQQVAFDELMALKGRGPLKEFKPQPLPRL